MMDSLLRLLDPQLLNVGVACFDGNWNYKNVRSNFFRIYYVESGDANVGFENGDMHLAAGNLYLIPALTRHGYRCTGKFRHYYIHFYDRNFQQALYGGGAGLCWHAEAHPSDAWQVRRLCSLLADRALTDFSPTVYDNPATLHRIIRSNSVLGVDKAIEAKAIVMQLLARFMKGIVDSAGRDPRILRAVKMIDANPGKACLDEVIADACMSKSHFYRLFARDMGCSPAEYISKGKLNAVILCLKLTTMPLAEVAYYFGFSDLSYFIRFFRKHTGVTPLRFRRHMQQAGDSLL